MDHDFRFTVSASMHKAFRKLRRRLLVSEAHLLRRTFVLLALSSDSLQISSAISFVDKRRNVKTTLNFENLLEELKIPDFPLVDIDCRVDETMLENLERIRQTLELEDIQSVLRTSIALFLKAVKAWDDGLTMAIIDSEGVVIKEFELG